MWKQEFFGNFLGWEVNKVSPQTVFPLTVKQYVCLYRGILKKGALKEWKRTGNVFPIHHFFCAFCCLWTSSWPVFGLLALVSSVPLPLPLCYFQSVITNHTCSTWASLDPSSSSCCFEADLIYAQGWCCRSQIRDIRALQGCAWLPLPFSSRGTHSPKMLRRLKEVGQNSRRRSLYCMLLAGYDYQ